MFYQYLYPLTDSIPLFNLFKYITVRTFGALVTAMVLYFVFGGPFIVLLKSKQFGQVIREDGPKEHLKKRNTPTMGGLLIIVSILVATLLFGRLDNVFVWMSLAMMMGFAGVGAYDDYLKVIRKDPNGFRGQYKIVIEFALVLALGLALYGWGFLDTALTLPFVKNIRPDLGVFYLFFAVIVVVGTANAVNLTDGLDGLVTGPSLMSFFSYGVLAYAVGHAGISAYLQVPHILGVGELSVICGATMGALIGFLWFNTHPAQIFMGDVGALGLGGLLGTVALITKNEILLVLIGGIFVLETVSVIVQVASFRLTGKRVFRMAPIHHHFEMKGWQETKVIVRFWIIAFILCLVALSTLKIR